MKKNIKEDRNSDLKNQLTRALADYDNLRKRIEREKEEIRKTANLALALRFLPVYDVLVAAQKHLKDPALELALREFTQAFEDNQIEALKVEVGDRFNEEIHEVVEVEKEGKKDTIREVVLAGWRFENGPVIRPAKVKVVR